MNTFWGYPGADMLAIAVIGAGSALCLLCAVWFVKGYGK